MGANLYWNPVLPVEQNDLPDALRYAIAQKFWGHDGTLNGSPKRLTEANLEYLYGIRDAKVDGAQELIDAIHKFGEIEVFIE